MMISRRAFLKGGASVGAAALMLAFPLAAAAEGDQEQNGLDEVKILQSAAEDGYLRITLDTVSRSANKDNPDASLVMLGFSVTNLTAAPVWLYHVHGYPMREYYDGSNCAAGTFQGQAIQTQMVLSDQMVKLDQSTDEGKNLCVSYGVNPGETIQLTITGSMASEAGTLSLTLTPPEQHGANADAHHSTYSFAVEFPQKCTPDSVQIGYQ